jgi:hypothetical protein
MIQQSESRFSEKNMRHQNGRAPIRFNLKRLRSGAGRTASIAAFATQLTAPTAKCSLLA